jgi:hypothetical protein
MKRILLSVLGLTAVIIMFAVDVPAAAVATPGGDFIDMYKAFFRDMQANRHEQVWDTLSGVSKNAIVKTVHESALASNKQSGQAGIMDMFNKNTSGIRAEYFKNLNEGFEKISFYKNVLEGQYTVKSTAKDRVVLTITVKKAPMDFGILLENGRWKINFFDDMMR